MLAPPLLLTRAPPARPRPRSGTTKKLKVTRRISDAASGRQLPVEEVLEVAVKPGWKEGTRITFEGAASSWLPGRCQAALLPCCWLQRCSRRHGLQQAPPPSPRALTRFPAACLSSPPPARAGKGDELPGQPAADLVFVVKQLPHERFTRQGNDLHARVKVPLVAALAGGAVQVRGLGGWLAGGAPGV